MQRVDAESQCNEANEGHIIVKFHDHNITALIKLIIVQNWNLKPNTQIKI